MAITSSTRILLTKKIVLLESLLKRKRTSALDFKNDTSKKVWTLYRLLLRLVLFFNKLLSNRSKTLVY